MGPWRARWAGAAFVALTVGVSCAAPAPTPTAGATSTARPPTSEVVAAPIEPTAPASTVAATSSTTIGAAAPTTPAAATTTMAPGPVPAAAVLDGIEVTLEHPEGYRRESFPTWLTVDARACDARVLVLLRESTTPLGDGSAGCSLAGGSWVSPYDGTAITDPGNAEIDHLVSVKEAWDSGAWAWSDDQRTAFANDVTDVRTLHAVTPSANRAKGDRDPSNWLPPRAGYVCAYVAQWVAVKARWRLTMDPSEAGRIRNLLAGPCSGTAVEPWAPAPERLAPRGAVAGAGPATTVAATSPATIQGLLTPVPATTPATAPPDTEAPPETAPPADAVVTPGAFCRVVGATGTSGGKAYVCDRYSRTGSSYQGDRPHWRPV